MKSHCRFSGVSIVLCLVTVTSQVLANPTGASLRAGRARFDRSAPGELSIHQQTDKVIINWREFSIAAGETTRFIQPSATSIALNRVVTANPSRLFGNLEANGKVYLINPSGILVGRGGAVNTRGFVASTLDVSDASFLSGARLRLSGDSEAPVVNEGSIQAIGGDVFLVGRTVENSGAIRAGTVGLGAGSEVMIVPAGRERLSVIAGNPNGGQAARGVNNEGTIEAVSAELKAAGGNIYALAINNGGIIRATGVRREGGRVFLSAGGGDIENSGVIAANNANGSGGFVSLAGGHDAANPATVFNTGVIEARGGTAGARGGEVRMTGDYVGLFGSSVIDVSGQAGGGAALIGGDYQGANPRIQNAQRTSVGPNAVIRADALSSGNGGRVILWADETTRFHGSVSARGGQRAGDGGFVETSGKVSLEFRGTADLRAARGRSGMLLLDPQDVVIEDVAVPPGSADDAEIADATINGTDGAGTFTISRGALEALSGSADILIAATRHITLNDLAGDLLNLATGSGNSVTFRADSDDSGSGDFTMAVGDTIRTAGGAVAITGEDLTVGNIDTTGAGAVAAGATVGLNGQNMVLGGTITAGSSDITVAVRPGASSGDLVLGAGSGTGLDLDSGDLDGFVTSGTVHFVAGTGGSLEVQGDVDFGALNLRLAGPGNISFQDADTLTTTGNVTLNAGTDGTGSISGNNDGVAHVAANNLTVTTGTGDIGSSGNPLTVDANSLTASTAGAVGDNIFLLDTAGGLSALDINAGAGDATLTVAAGAVTDTDAFTDITAADATVVLNDATPQNFGASGNRIATSVSGLSVDTATGGGDQFVTEANGLTGLNLNAGAGDIDLLVTLGSVLDTDGTADITADQATVSLLAGTAQDFGASGDAIATSVNDLTVSTAAGGGDQFIVEANGLTALDLNAGAGDLNLTLTLGAVADTDGAADLTAADAAVTLLDGTAQGFGALANAINTSVGGLSVDTSAGGGSQFISEANGLTGLDLDAGAGDVNLTVLLGGVFDTVGAADITAANAVVALNDATAQDFGASGNRIGTSVDSLSVDTSAGGGDLFITEANGLTALNLNAGAGDVSLTLTLGGVTDADGAAIDITAANATVILSALSAQDFGASGAANNIHTDVDSLAVDTSAGGGDQFVTEANGLNGLNLNAGGGDVDLTLTLGSLLDTDGLTDITAGQAVVTLLDATAQAFGTSGGEIATSVDDLTANSAAGGGDLFITEANGLTGLNLNAGAGNVNMTLTAGALADTDGLADITANQATLVLSDAAAQDVGSGANPIDTSVADLSVSTAAGDGDQFITEASGLTGFDLNAGSGNVNLTLTLGALLDTDAAADITAGNATVLLSDAAVQDFGAAANAINTSVGGLSVDTSLGGGNQFITEASGLTGLNLNAAGGDVALTLTLGGVADADGAADITADQATLVLSDAAAQGFGSGANRIATSVNDLSVSTSAGGGDQFITEANGLTALNLNAGAGDVDLILTLGALADLDAAADITAGDATVLLSDVAVQNAGTAANVIHTSAGTLSVDTSAGGGSQFITEASGLTALDLDAGAGSVNLTLAAGSVLDTDANTDIDAVNVSVGAIGGAGTGIGAAANPIEIDASGPLVTLTALGGTGSGVHVEVAQAGDVTFTDSQPFTASAVRTIFTRGATTFDTYYVSDLTLRANGSILSAAGVTVLSPGSLGLNAVGGGIGGGIGSPIRINAGTLNATAATGLSFSEAGDVTLGDISTTGGPFFIEAANTLAFNAATTIDAGAGTAILVANGIPGISVVGDPAMNSRFLIYALNAELTDPLTIIDSMGNPTIGGLDADVIDSPVPFNPLNPDPFPDMLDHFVFSLEANPPTDPSLYIDIPVEVFQPVSIVFGQYDPTKFGEVGDLWMSSSELYEIERKAGKARKALPPQVNRSKYVPENN